MEASPDRNGCQVAKPFCTYIPHTSHDKHHTDETCKRTCSPLARFGALGKDIIEQEVNSSSDKTTKSERMVAVSW